MHENNLCLHESRIEIKTVQVHTTEITDFPIAAYILTTNPNMIYYLPSVSVVTFLTSGSEILLFLSIAITNTS